MKRTHFPLPERYPVNLYFRLDSLLGITSSLMTRHFSVYFLPAAVLLVAVLVLGNFFCFWVCPLGGLIDAENLVSFRRKWRFTVRFPVVLRNIRFFILAGIVLVSVLGLFAAGIPYVAWVPDPLVILARALIVKKEWLVALLLILALSLLIPRGWCNIFCPLGGLFFLAGTARRRVSRSRGARSRKNA
jgi:polyferredoxin